MTSIPIMGALALAAGAVAALILLHHLLFRPKLDTAARVRLLLGLGVFPVLAAGATTAFGMHRTTERTFCGSCHVMGKHLSDVEDPTSNSLASRHGRNKYIGEENCYVCHANYGMLGYPLTKLKGMAHVYNYFLGGYNKLSLEEAVKEIRIATPFPNSNCMQCHSGKLASFANVRDHLAVLDELESNKVSCASVGCHGYSHPFSKRPGEGTGLEAKEHEKAEGAKAEPAAAPAAPAPVEGKP
jgi:cytochrome c-type protein NapC